ncbi:MAG: hypothetical protein LBO75_04145 [Bifidobacteriaceae bacterium]|nr:hypothetical protein [Bifidobacteriaceae bacterium]
MRQVVTHWTIFLVLLAVTLLPPVRNILTEWREGATEKPVQFVLDMGLNFWWAGIAVVLSSWAILRHRQIFESLRLYEDGLGLVQQGVERLVPWPEAKFTMGSLGESFHMEIRSVGLKQAHYSWTDFTQPSKLEALLRRFGTWL